MKNNCFVIYICFFLFCSCGVVSKARYGNGLKINLEFNRFKKDDNRPVKYKQKTKVRKFIPVEDTSVGNMPLKEITPLNVLSRPQDKESSSADKNWSIIPSTLLVKNKIKHLAKEVQSSSVLQDHRKKDLVLEPDSKTYERYMEPNVTIAALLFYGGIAASFIPYINLIASIAILVGFIMALIGLRNIRLSDGAFKGYGLALSIVILFILGALLTLFLILLLAAFFI